MSTSQTGVSWGGGENHHQPQNIKTELSLSGSCFKHSVHHEVSRGSLCAFIVLRVQRRSQTKMEPQKPHGKQNSRFHSGSQQKGALGKAPSLVYFKQILSCRGAPRFQKNENILRTMPLLSNFLYSIIKNCLENALGFWDACSMFICCRALWHLPWIVPPFRP